MQIKKEYLPASHAAFGKEKAQIFGEHLDALQQKVEILTPIAVVNDAKSKDSPIHSYFDWNDKVAGAKHRIHQARLLMNSIRVKYIDADGKEGEIRKFHNIKVRYQDEDSEQGYVSVDAVIQSKELTEQVIQYALSELNAWSRRYQQYEQLKLHIETIDKVAISLKDLSSVGNNRIRTQYIPRTESRQPCNTVM